MNIVINGNSLVELKKLATESIDLVVSDVPYKIKAGGIKSQVSDDDVGGGIFIKRNFVSDGTACSNKWIKKNSNYIAAAKSGKMFKHNDIEFDEWMPDVYRVLKKGTHCYLMVNGSNLCKLQVSAEKSGFVFQQLIVWSKNNCTPNRYYMGSAEFILMLSKRPAKSINNKGTKNILTIPNIIGNKLHPTEKPVELMDIFIENSSVNGDVVLDMFCGSGATLLSAKKLNRKYIGIEIDEEYVNVSTGRLSISVVPTSGSLT